ncbi:hypothetical protein [Paenibacillus sp. YYML68]|uniref:hypothetical protein n=1 Tax=Paenibacillus sp. YYML68 TaxID=2909250 RepID=UPI0024907561|nr:hypothetical protein [Paenibacillus sp. YYML68]
MELQSMLPWIAVAGTVSGIVLGWKARSRSVQQDTVAEASKDAALQADMAYIKRGVDDMRVEIKMQGQRYEQLSERVTRVEESTKQAHYRLNRMDGKE